MPEGNKIDLSGDGSVLKEILEEGKGTVDERIAAVI